MTTKAWLYWSDISYAVWTIFLIINAPQKIVVHKYRSIVTLFFLSHSLWISI